MEDRYSENEKDLSEQNMKIMYFNQTLHKLSTGPKKQFFSEIKFHGWIMVP